MSSSKTLFPTGPLDIAPDVMAGLQQRFSQAWARLLDEHRAGRLPPLNDRRFKSEEWSDSAHHLLMAHAYLLSARTMLEMVDAVQHAGPARERLRFAVMQWVDALSPSNYLATNPEAQASIVASAGRAMDMGLSNLVNDLGLGRITQTDETQFEVGRNLAVTPGAVVFENALFQLIQYSPTTPAVHTVPLLVVPPNINKFYVLDLQPANSFIGHAVAAGFSVYAMSWRNPLAGDKDGIHTATWTDYLDDAVLRAVAVVQEISGQKQINALGFCVGGTLLASALALAHARGQRPVRALTLLTTLLDFRDTGVLDVFVDEAHAALRERAIGAGGLMWGNELATTFAFLRPNELVWNYVVSNYLKGETPPPFDLLYWNADPTNLPGPFFAWYFRNTYLENNLCQPGRLRVGDAAIDLSGLDIPTYLFGSREDHIVPWASAYASTRLLPRVERFVLGASGHIAGVVNPPAKQRRSYWSDSTATTAALPSDPLAWLDRADETTGSWWPDWHAWLGKHSGRRRQPPGRLGSDAWPEIEPAPGRYVKVRI